MGLVKRLMDEEDARGWRSFGGDVCAECVVEDFLASYVAENATANRCDFCGRVAGRPIAVDSDEVMELIGEGLYREWTHPVQVMGRADGEWVGTTYDAWELLEAVGIEVGSDFGEKVAEAFLDDLWCEANPYALQLHEILSYGWERFANHVKYRTRYVFLLEKEEEEFPDPDEIHPGLMLQRLEEVVRATGIIRPIPKGTRFFRARDHQADEKPERAKDLGTPPPEYARKPNRMSPAGIPMFYGAGDPETVIAEMGHSDLPVATIAEFETMRDLRLMDLNKIPEVPSLFDELNAAERPAFRFLRNFAEAISQPISADGREHIDYVPTQVVTDYFRRIFKDDEGGRLNGLLFRSSRHDGGQCCVLFVENGQCVDSADETDGVLLLDRSTVTRIDLPRREGRTSTQRSAD